jgi:hypothetical protein
MNVLYVPITVAALGGTFSVLPFSQTEVSHVRWIN